MNKKKEKSKENKKNIENCLVCVNACVCLQVSFQTATGAIKEISRHILKAALFFCFNAPFYDCWPCRLSLFLFSLSLSFSLFTWPVNFKHIYIYIYTSIWHIICILLIYFSLPLVTVGVVEKLPLVIYVHGLTVAKVSLADLPPWVAMSFQFDLLDAMNFQEFAAQDLGDYISLW